MDVLKADIERAGTLLDVTRMQMRDSPLWVAACFGHLEIARFLVDRGAQVEMHSVQCTVQAGTGINQS